MTATFAFDQDYGAATGSPARGASTTTGISNMNWQNGADPTVAYTTNPITAGNNSFEIAPFGHFSGSYNQIGGSIKFAHITTAFGTGLQLIGTPGSQVVYRTPAATTYAASLTTDMTTAIGIGSGTAILVGPTAPSTAGKTTSTTSNPAYTEFLETQLLTLNTAAAGDTAQVTLELEYLES